MESWAGPGNEASTCMYKQRTVDSNNSNISFQFPEVNILLTGRRGLEGLRPDPIDTRREMGSFKLLLR